MATYYLSYRITYLFDEEEEFDFNCKIVEATSLANAKRQQHNEILKEYGTKTKVTWDDCYRTSDDARL